jgi:hypothetical protein
MGPIVLFDKSFLQSISFDEAAIFDALYSANVCPIFFVETLADLKKSYRDRSPEDEVSRLAGRTPRMHSYPNVHHRELCLASMMGQNIKLRGAPVVGQGIPVRQDGKTGVFYEPSPESKALSRWQRGQFAEWERDVAGWWRSELKFTDLKQSSVSFLSALKCSQRPSSFVEARDLAHTLVRADGRRFVALKAAWSALQLDEEFWNRVLNRWKALGGPPLSHFAPYAAYVFSIDIFFNLCLAAGLISSERTSNKIDIAYLYYLPFCMLFVSSDKLHAKTAPLFLNKHQIFLEGADLKSDLVALDSYYSAKADEIAKEGLFRVASRPPADDRFLTQRIWTRFLGRPTAMPLVGNVPVPESLRNKLEAMSKLAKSPTGKFSRRELDDPDQLVIQREVPLSMGKWRLLPEGVQPE